ncbi:DUF461 domain-containing protein [Kitasatospora sp. NPDC096077]|uniref:DUF461 domain-containing protein n=1 Tax=Kitasatospora sp. NPDC096077 TaxID=3155544 RepID=UPI00332F75CF
MSRSLRRGSIAAIAAIAIASLSSCAASNTPDTLQVKPDNAAATLGTDLRLNNIVIVTGAGTSGDYTGPANVVVNISNTATTPAELQSITVGNGAAATFADAAGAPQPSIVIPAGGSVALGAQGGPSATLGSAAVHVGGFSTTTFTFKGGQKVDTQAGVSPATGLYTGFGPTPAAVPGHSASPAAGAPATPSTGAGTTGAPATPSTGATTPGTPATPGAPVAGGSATATAPAAH